MLRNRWILSASLAAAMGLGLAAPRFLAPARAADEKEKKDDSKMTRADRVRDAKEHLTKAMEQLQTANVDEKGHDGAAYLECKKAIEECDKYLEEVDKGKKAQ